MFTVCLANLQGARTNSESNNCHRLLSAVSSRFLAKITNPANYFSRRYLFEIFFILCLKNESLLFPVVASLRGSGQKLPEGRNIIIRENTVKIIRAGVVSGKLNFLFFSRGSSRSGSSGKSIGTGYTRSSFTFLGSSDDAYSRSALTAVSVRGSTNRKSFPRCY